MSTEFDDPVEPEVAPPVVLVMVAHDPGWWFDETLVSVALQDYPELTTLVVDAGSADPDALRTRIAAVLPDAHVRRLPENPGFAAAANEVLGIVQGAAFHVLCHDDVRLAPDAVRLMVEEAFRSNAGVVGPKLVEWADPRRLLSVGMGSDRFGQPAPYVERGDLDQEQHDAVRDVFYIPGAVTLVRSDLFETLEGFDAEMTFHGEDLDLCWRSHVAGARVIVAPSAVVAHLEALGVRRPADDRRRLQARHRMRAMRVAQTLGTRMRTTPESAVLSLAEIIQAVVLGHFRRARDIWSAWTWNAGRRSTTIARRHRLESLRRVPDGEVHDFQARGSARLSGFLRSRVVQSEAAAGGRELVSNLRSARSSTSFLVWLVIVIYMIIGSRELLLHGVPAVGDFVRFLGPGQMLSRWSSGWQGVGLGSTAPAPTGFGVLGMMGAVLLGATGLLRAILILGMWPLGVIGVWRFTRPIGSSRSRLVATVVYAVLPVAPNAIAQGQWGALVVYAVLPWIVGQFAAASGVAPFGSLGDAAGPGVRERPLRHRVVLAGLVVALGMVIEPAVAPIALGVGLLLVVGGLLAGQVAGAGRVLAVSVGAVAVACVLHLPWSLSFLDGWAAVVGTSSNGGYPLGVGDVLRFGSGPYGTGAIGWAVLITAALSLLIGRRWRLGWAVRGWTFALAGFGLAWMIGRGVGVDLLPSASSLLVVAALGIALSAGLGMAAFEADLPDYHFGWRQLLSLVAAGAFVLALVPALGAAMSGRWATPRGDFDRSLSFLDDGDDQGVSRILWIGDAAALPLSGWALDAPNVDDLGPDRTLAYATTMGGTPSIAEQWAGAPSDATGRIADAIRTASEGGTARLGALLAPMGVREIIVPLAPAPDPYAQSRSYVPSDLLSVLDAQLDLAAITVNPGVRLYRNSAWAPVFSQLPSSTEFPSGGDLLSDRTDRDLAGAPAVLTTTDGFATWTGGIPYPSVVHAAVDGSDWTLRVDGVEAERSTAFGWSNSFTVTNSGAAKLSYDTPSLRRYLLFVQVLLWIAAVVFVLRGRVRIEERALLVTDAPDDADDGATDAATAVALTVASYDAITEGIAITPTVDIPSDAPAPMTDVVVEDPIVDDEAEVSEADPVEISEVTEVTEIVVEPEPAVRVSTPSSVAAATDPPVVDPVGELLSSILDDESAVGDEPEVDVTDATTVEESNSDIEYPRRRGPWRRRS